MNSKYLILLVVTALIFTSCFNKKEKPEEKSILEEAKKVAQDYKGKRAITSTDIVTGIYLKKGSDLYLYEYEAFFKMSDQDSLNFATNWGNADPNSSYVVFGDDIVTTISLIRNNAGDFYQAKNSSNLTVYSDAFSTAIDKNTIVKDGLNGLYKYADGTGPKVKLDLETGTYDKGTEVSISSDNGDDIRYSIDGTKVDVNSLQYTSQSSITIDKNFTLKARAYSNDWVKGDQVERKYYITPRIKDIIVPQDNNKVSKTTDIKIQFNKEMDNTKYGIVSFSTPGITFKDGVNSTISFTTTLEKNDTVRIMPNTNLIEKQEYKDIKVEKFVALNGVEMLPYEDSDYDFVVSDVTNPKFESITPKDESKKVATDSDINIKVIEELDSSVFGVINLNGTEYNTTNSSITVTGSSIILNPDNDFSEETVYSSLSISGFKDLSGNELTYTDNNYKFETDDETKPTINSITPVNSSDVALNQNIIIVFDEGLKADDFGKITINSIEYIDGTNCSMSYAKTNVGKDSVIIDLNSDFESETQYTIGKISGFKDDFGNVMVDDTTGYTFTTKDKTDPEVGQINSPLDNTTAVATSNTIDIVFNESLDNSIYGKISFENPTVTYINGINCSITFSDTNSTNDTVSIDPTNGLKEITTYQGITIENFKDTSGNLLSIHNNSQYSFVTADESSPVLKDLIPGNNSKEIATSDNIKITVDEKLDENEVGTIILNGTIYENGTNAAIDISDSIITLNPDNDFSEQVEYGNISISGFKDLSGNSFNYSDSSYKFTTADETAPVVDSHYPTSGDVIDPSDNIEIILNETLNTGTFGTVSFGTPAVTFTNGDNCKISFTKTNKTADTIVIDPDSALTDQINYSNITIDGFKDISGNIMNNVTDSTYNFDTNDKTAPKVSNITPVDDSTGVATNSNIEIIFNESLDNTIYGKVSIDSPAVTYINGVNSSITFGDTNTTNDTVIIDPSNDFQDQKSYENLRVEGFADDSGNVMTEDIDADYNFMTSDDHGPAVNYMLPLNSSTELSKKSNFKIVFDGSLDTSINGSLTFSDTGVTFDENNSLVSFSTTDSPDDTVIIVPNSDLESGTDYSNVSISGFKDNSGNSMTAYNNSNYSIITEDYVAPTLDVVTIRSDNSNSSYAKVGDKVTLDITASEDITTPTVTLAGVSVTVDDKSDGDDKTWQATYTLQSSDAEGDIGFSIDDYKDTSNNANEGTQVTTATDSSSVLFDKTVPSVNAGSDVGWTNNTVNLDSTNSDSVSGIASYSWTKTTGTGTVTFSDSTIEDPTFEGANSTDTIYTITLKVSDKAGNSQEDTVEIRWDNQIAAPSGLDLAAEDDSGKSDDNITNQTTGLTISGAAEVSSTVEIFKEGNSVGTVIADGSGNWSKDMDLTDGDKTYSITAKTTDKAGNVSELSSALEIGIDTTEPTITSGNLVFPN